jgi:choline dehydrogenase
MSTEQNYDYIIADAGSAGYAVAGRLSENGNLKVLLVQTGESRWVLLGNRQF